MIYTNPCHPAGNLYPQESGFTRGRGGRTGPVLGRDRLDPMGDAIILSESMREGLKGLAQAVMALPEPKVRGPYRRRTKMTIEIARAVQALYAQGLSYRAIAPRIGISRPMVQRCVVDPTLQ